MVNLNSPLNHGDWHHLALCWSRGEFVGYLDGRPFYSTDMSQYRGFAFACNVGISVMINGIVLDELRISDVVRYESDFEPNWRDGKRPDYAFAGIPGIKRYPPDLKLPVRTAPTQAAMSGKQIKRSIADTTLVFDGDSGYLQQLGIGAETAKRGANGLLLFNGLEREPVRAIRAASWRVSDDAITFVQVFETGIRASHRIAASDNVITWDVSLLNESPQEAWLEALLSLPVPFSKVKEFFDGSSVHRTTALPRRRDEYVCTMPFVAAAGTTMGIGIGLDPHVAFNALVAEWMPERNTGTIRQGTKLALAPGERFTLPFLVLSTPADFGTLDALEAYQDNAPDLYHLLPDVPIYSYLPAGSSPWQESFHDFYRLTYTGNYWGHGPGHDQGDYYGSSRWWDNAKLYGQKSYQYTMQLESSYHSLETLRELIRQAARTEFDNYYPVRRIHTCPDLLPEHIINDLWPTYRPRGDPLVRGQYFYDHWGWLMVNEHNTPLGRHVRDDIRRYYRGTAPYISGFMNDMSDLSLLRHDDPIAKQTPGRAFSRDRGTYVLGHAGRMDRYRMINSFVDNSHRSSIWSDGGFGSYVACAYSAAQANEICSEHYGYLTGTTRSSRLHGT